MIHIDGTLVDKTETPYIIAEISANHNGSLEKALQCIKQAKECGANAVKIQTYTADTMTIDSNDPEFTIMGGLWDGYKLYDLYSEAQTPLEWHPELFKYAKQIGITIFSTPFDESAVDFLETLGAPAYKIASFEAVDLPLIKYVAKTKKPLIISTGMCSRIEITEAIDAALSAGCNDIIILHCISSYPTPLNKANISKIRKLADTFGTQVGLSDHTLGTTASIVAVSLGATVIEKHFTLDRKEGGPDSEFSIEPEELRELCNKTKQAWHTLGDNSFERDEKEVESKMFRRSIYFVKDMVVGQKITNEDIRRIRPGKGLPPRYYDSLLGSTLKEDVKRGTAVQWKHLNLND